MKYLLLSSIAILIAYSVLIHPFEVPDEGAHYSSLHFLVNSGRMPIVADKDNLSVEELKTEAIFGVVEHDNRYSFHPEYRMQYVPGLIGKYEEDIKSLNTDENRNTYSTYQAATYPPLYYALTLPFYNLVSGGDILLRLFVSRFSSVIMTTLTIFVAFQIGSLGFKQRSYGLTIALMTLFFPMTAYVGAGVSSDNLHNLLFAIATYLALKVVRDGWSRNLALAVGIVIGLDLITKPQGYILIPIFVLATIVRWNWGLWRQILIASLYVLVPILLLAGWQELPKLILGNSAVGVTSYTARVVEHGGWDNFLTFGKAYLRTHTTEMIVWYWGVFKWFGVIMPRFWWWIANRLLGLAGLGLLITLVRDIKKKKLSTDSKYIIFSLGANAIYIAALAWFDWQFYQEYGRSLGLQPRYYMPLLISQMYLFLFGLSSLGWNKRIKEYIRVGVILFFLGLQLASMYTQLTSYYDLSPLSTFIDQVSQYKPWFAKGNWWYLWFSLYFAGILSVTIIALKNRPSKT